MMTTIKRPITPDDVVKIWKWVSDETPASKRKGGKNNLMIAADHGHDFHNTDDLKKWLEGLDDQEKLKKIYDDIAYSGRRPYWN